MTVTALHDVHSSMKHYIEDSTYLKNGIRGMASIRRLWEGGGHIRRGAQQSSRFPRRIGRILNTVSLLILTWSLIIWWGERWTFQSSLRECQWQKWERWVSDRFSCHDTMLTNQNIEANPHRVVLIADPQLVDPHTYPGRPWPLSTLTIFYTDLYLGRSYRYLQEYLQPDTILFLGDLFDGGREWGNDKAEKKSYTSYGKIFWKREYRRFIGLFFGNLQASKAGSQATQYGRRTIASLPGNHDLGFATGIQPAVKERFDAYFGPLNRVDIVGNHSFISVDSASLSAMDQVDPATGSSRMTGDNSIWKSVDDFLSSAKILKKRAIARDQRLLLSQPEQLYSQQQLASFTPVVADLSESPPLYPSNTQPSLSAHYPTILLTHVPLYRPPNEPCGPLRESSNPSIRVAAGYQYQNVLTPQISKDIVSRLTAEEIAAVYSGDDHDYCEIEHVEFTGRIREITVKSMSWAMGIRRPGFLEVSLHNPVNVNSNVVGIPRDTIQNHLCLLPDQLGIFIRYAQLLVLTFMILAIRTLLLRGRHNSLSTSHQSSLSRPLLPLTEKQQDGSHSSSSSSSLPSSSPPERLSTRSTLRAMARSPSPSKNSRLGGYGNLPTSSRSSSPTKRDIFPPLETSHMVTMNDERPCRTDDWGISTDSRRSKDRRVSSYSKIPQVVRDFGWSVWQVAWPVLLFYFWVIWHG